MRRYNGNSVSRKVYCRSIVKFHCCQRLEHSHGLNSNWLVSPWVTNVICSRNRVEWIYPGLQPAPVEMSTNAMDQHTGLGPSTITLRFHNSLVSQLPPIAGSAHLAQVVTVNVRKILHTKQIANRLKINAARLKLFLKQQNWHSTFQCAVDVDDHVSAFDKHLRECMSLSSRFARKCGAHDLLNSIVKLVHNKKRAAWKADQRNGNNSHYHVARNKLRAVIKKHHVSIETKLLTGGNRSFFKSITIVGDMLLYQCPCGTAMVRLRLARSSALSSPAT